MLIFLQDVRYAIRAFQKSLALTLIIVLSLAIGIGSNAAIFSVVDALLLRPLPYPQPDRLADVWLHSPRIGINRDWPSPGEFIDLQNENHSFERMALAQSRAMTLTGRDKPELLNVMKAQSSLLAMLGAKPQWGRLVLPDEDKPGKPAIAILTDGVWKRLFGSDREIVGKTIVLDGEPVQVAGVLQRGFSLSSEVMTSEVLMNRIDVFVPLPLPGDAVNRRLDENFNIMVKLKPSLTLRQAQSDVDAIASRIREKDKRDISFGMDVIGLREQVVGNVRRALLVVFGSVALVLLIACANVAGLLLTRAAGREKEVAIRTALGAGWERIARQMLTESILLGLAGGMAGLFIAQMSLYIVRAVNPGNIPRLDDITINSGVIAFTLSVSITTGILFGLAPAWRAIRVDVNSSLKAGGRSGQGDSGLHMRRRSLRGLLVISELALSIILLVAAGLLIRSFLRLENVKLGFVPDHLLSMDVSLPASRYRDQKAAFNLYRELESRIAVLPGVVSEGFAYPLPLTGAVSWGLMHVEGYSPPPGEELQVDVRGASADYFHTMGVPLIKGRFFTDRDTVDMPQVALIDERFAQRFWANGDPIGKHLWFDPKKPITIVGVVGSVKQYGLETDGKIAAYLSYYVGPNMFLTVRTSSDPGAMSGTVLSAIREVDPAILVYDARTMQGRLSDLLARQRFSGAMLTAFAFFALLLAAVGLYGLLSHQVTQSAHDIGLLAALGAQRRDVFGLVARQGMSLAAIGILAGLAAAAILSRVIASLLFGVGPMDAVTFGAVPAVLACVAFGAIIIPAWRATRVNPTVALREE